MIAHYISSIIVVVQAKCGALIAKVRAVDLHASCTNITRVPNSSPAGIGNRTALHLARMGAKVIMACRSVQRGEEARAKMEKEIR